MLCFDVISIYFLVYREFDLDPGVSDISIKFQFDQKVIGHVIFAKLLLKFSFVKIYVKKGENRSKFQICRIDPPQVQINPDMFRTLGMLLVKIGSIRFSSGSIRLKIFNFVSFYGNGHNCFQKTRNRAPFFFWNLDSKIYLLI